MHGPLTCDLLRAQTRFGESGEIITITGAYTYHHDHQSIKKYTLKNQMVEDFLVVMQGRGVIVIMLF
jgi:hydroxymethylpyrimidine pyrophosphatase-like HAD family hydrolase